MAKGNNQKLKLSFLTKIMLEKTDENHKLTMPQIIEELAKYEVSAERKSIYSDFDDMTDKLGIEILKEQVGRETYYWVAARQFELAEIKLLIDSVLSSKFITEKKSRELIGKIKTLVSEHDAKLLQRQIFVQGRIKTMNECIYYNVDDIHHAMNVNKKIKFQYYKWNIDKTLVPRHYGDFFTVSPWALTWDDENYYLVAFDDFSKTIKHYRVDKMMKMSEISEAREGKEEFGKYDMASYSKMNFGMYNGRVERVTISFPNNMCGVFLDRFGKDISFRRIDEERSSLAVSVAISPQFFGWIFSLGKQVRVEGPAEVVTEMGEFLQDLCKNYLVESKES